MNTTRAKRGRPRKPDGEARTLALPSIRVSVAELSFIETQAHAAGLPVSAYVRKLATGRRVSPRTTALEDKLLVELNRCGVNLHQIVKALNFGQGLPSDIASVTDELRTAIAHVSAAYDA